MGEPPALAFHRGTLTLAAPASAALGAPFAWDDRAGLWRAAACDYAAAREAAGSWVEDRVLALPDVPDLAEVALRPYQEDALAAWEAAGERGVVVLPTGAGKTHVALAAFERLRAPVLVVVPTLDLVDQWVQRFRQAFPRLPVGTLTGAEKDVRVATVATYDSAYLLIERIGNRFGLVVFDECHHLPSPGYRQIAEMCAAPARLGLSATPERADGAHADLERLVGPIVARLAPESLSGTHLAPYEVRRVEAELAADERAEYERHHEAWIGYVRGGNGRRPASHKILVMRSGSDPEARKALLARERARDVTFNARAKRAALLDILRRHRGERTLVFTEHNRLVAALSKELLVPGITHKTPTDERAEILRKFRAGEYPIVVASKVLDEGVDVPEAAVGVVLSGSGSPREFAQRLGRLLRPGPGKRAVLYEVVTKDSTEERTSERRRKAIGGGGDAPA